MAEENLYGATPEDVMSHLPHLELAPEDDEASDIGGETRLSQTDLHRFLDTTARWVRARIGSLDNLEEDAQERAEGMARTVVVLGAATWAEAGAFPERADIADTTYAGFLYKAYREALDELLESLGIGTDQGGGAAPAPDKPLAAFPVPLLTRDRSF